MKQLLRRARRAREFFPLCSRKQRANQAAKYAKAVQYLGSEWLFIKELERVQPL